MKTIITLLIIIAYTAIVWYDGVKTGYAMAVADATPQTEQLVRHSPPRRLHIDDKLVLNQVF